jgi:hypothetical protein
MKQTIFALIAVVFALIAMAGNLYLAFNRTTEPIIQETVIIEEKVPVFDFVTYQYVVHTVERYTYPKGYLFDLLKSETTFIFEYFGKVQIYVSKEDIIRQTVAPGTIRITDDMFHVQIVEPYINPIAQFTNDPFSNTVPYEVVMKAPNEVSKHLKDVVISDGGLELAKESFMTQYRQLFESYGIKVKFIRID